jgi:hypothetical protein
MIKIESRALAKKTWLWLLGVTLLVSGCNKIVQVSEPVNTITTSETFSNDGNATSAIIGIYNDILSGNYQNFDYGNGLTTFYAGLSADELLYFNITGSEQAELQYNDINSSIGTLDYFWAPAYYDIYMSNAAIEGLTSSTSVTPTLKTELLGEAKFFRAFAHFYLLNLFGNIPLLTTTAWESTANLPQAIPAQVYGQIVADLHDAQSLLASDYSYSNGERTRVNKSAATALLARVYLYQANWVGADSAASAVLDQPLYTLCNSLDSVFLANNTEAIWQLVPNALSQFATREGFMNIPYPANSGNPNYYLTSYLLNAFDSGDLRKVDWLDSTNYAGTVYYYPYKYKVQTSVAGTVPEYYTILRMAEQYLIRAEARANENNGGSAAIADLNVIRTRAGLQPYAGASDMSSVLNAIMHERQIEFFAEWGHRWFDLKRWGNATTVLSVTKGNPVPAYQLLWPIPTGEVTSDPNLHQNPQY